MVATFFITETYLTTFVGNFFYLTNFGFDPTDTPGVPRWPGGVGGDYGSLLAGPPLSATTQLSLDRVLTEDGFLFCRYLVS